jgi:peptidoglycan-associated lipoprotein
MRRFRLSTMLALAVLVPVVLLGAGCSKKTAKGTEEPTAPAPPPPAPTPPPEPTPPPPPPPEDTGAWKSQVQDVFFDFDKYDIRNDARTTLQDNARMLKEHGGGGLVLEGNCDERGTTEYNLALGQRRADAVKAYLKDLGVDVGQVQTVSYGEERPFAPGHDETAWSQNRRVHFRFQ